MCDFSRYIIYIYIYIYARFLYVHIKSNTVPTRAFIKAYRHSAMVAMALRSDITLVPPTDDKNVLIGLGVRIRTPKRPTIMTAPFKVIFNCYSYLIAIKSIGNNIEYFITVYSFYREHKLLKVRMFGEET